ncbi:MAG: polysaccharide deacetylase family protein [Pseudomonadota bacterium]
MKAVIKQLGLRLLTAPPLYGWLQKRALKDAPVTILCYHTLRPDHETIASWLALRQSDFAAQIAALRKTYDIVSLDQALAPATSDKPRAVLTFDDGEWAMQAHLLKTVEAEALPVTLYVATGQIETGQPYWFDRVINALQSQGETQITLDGLGHWTIGPALGKPRWEQIGAVLEALKAQPEDTRDALADQIIAQTEPADAPGFTPMTPMTLAQLQEVAAHPLVTIGAHSHGHELLDRITPDAARDSIARSKELLETWTGKSIDHFAYPNGNSAPAVVEILKDLGFRSATILGDRLAHASDPALLLPRISVGRYDALDRLRLRLVNI